MSLIILDRDGVINHDSLAFIKSPAEWEPIEGSLEAIARLNQAGYRVVIITNQSGIGRGLLDVEMLNRIHSKMRRMLSQVGGRIEAILFCPDGPDVDSPCRKPNPGMFLDLAHRLRLNLAQVPAVGDSLRDLQAAEAAGARPILVRTGKGMQTLEAGIPDKVAVYDDLAAVVDALLDQD
ncbi:Histidinol-phosphatase [Methylophaga frappieri]|uniref:D,D-heptose 1,7-bisphosphate phosphatase n=1 Tax=Methylophaga frappieri (strain ATCC BAA-2434 / DSM 25690 / JAM7) TaxID=754477 RepID=I1YK86_METFJ|nr:D-glycero-beta-D-manno-heptose 1,7-bisphosphate 7-phosphatase [Methylophaga frappieri]AFJ03329.1 Histidinol-phosphatase [Methylophaga frappieri]